MSEFYYSQGRDLFVGTLFAIGVFLWSYVGYPPDKAEKMPTDKQVSRIAAIAAICVALFPTADKLAAPGQAISSVFQCLVGRDASRIIHYLSAGVFFVALAVFCLVLFCRDGGQEQDLEKQGRNRIYKICGYTIISCIVALLVYFGVYAFQDKPGQDRLDQTYLVFIFEAIAIIAFAISWLVKGGSLKTLQNLMKPKTGR